MRALVDYFLQLALLRRGPQDLPASSALLGLLVVASLAVGSLNGARLFGGVRPAFGANLVDLVLTLGLLYLLLSVRGHTARWLQTVSAFLGLGVLVGVLMLLVSSVAVSLAIVDIAVLFDVVMAVWLHVALGNVLRHALDVPLLAGVIIMLSYTVLASNIILRIFPLAGTG